MIKVVLISDTHGMHDGLPTIPDGDILIHAGDCGENGFQTIKFMEWFNSLPHKHKVFIAGNHDRWIQNYPSDFGRELISHNGGIIYLQDSGVVLEGLQLYGSPWTRNLPRWAYQMDDEDAEDFWSKLDKDIDILITHGPAYGIGDKLDPIYQRRGEDIHVGCKGLLKQITAHPPKLHVFGHIHEGRNRYDVIPGCVSINASCVDERYQFYPAKAFEIEL